MRLRTSAAPDAGPQTMLYQPHRWLSTDGAALETEEHAGDEPVCERLTDHLRVLVKQHPALLGDLVARVQAEFDRNGLARLYREFAEEDRALAEQGIDDYSRLLDQTDEG